MSEPPIQTFTLDWPHLPDNPRPLLALGHKLPTQWFLLRPTVDNEYEPREFTCITVVAAADPTPRPMPNGNYVIALKNYTENDGILDRLELAGVVKRTGVWHEQGYVRIPMVEVLVPEERLVHFCANETCGQWEELDKPRFQRCSICKKTYYCMKTVRFIVA